MWQSQRVKGTTSIQMSPVSRVYVLEVLHGVLYLKAHTNRIQKKKKNGGMKLRSIKPESDEKPECVCVRVCVCMYGHGCLMQAQND